MTPSFLFFLAVDRLLVGEDQARIDESLFNGV